MAAAEKKTRRRAEVAEFYGLNPWALTRTQAAGLWANIPHLTARRQLRGLGSRPHPPTADEIYQLVLADTGDPARADDAWAAYRAEELRRQPAGEEAP
jgi:hypothetical protein